MVIESLAFNVFDIVNATGEIIVFNNLFIINSQLLSLVDFEIANNKVIKKLTLTEGAAVYAKNTSTGTSDLELETQIVLPPLLNYVLELRLPIALAAPLAGRTRYIQAQIIGTGGIIAPRTTF